MIIYFSAYFHFFHPTISTLTYAARSVSKLQNAKCIWQDRQRRCVPLTSKISLAIHGIHCYTAVWALRSLARLCCLLRFRFCLPVNHWTIVSERVAERLESCSARGSWICQEHAGVLYARAGSAAIPLPCMTCSAAFKYTLATSSVLRQPGWDGWRLRPSFQILIVLDLQVQEIELMFVSDFRIGMMLIEEVEPHSLVCWYR